MTGSGSEPVLAVGVGASAGGLEAFKRLLAALPDRTGMALLLVQHLSPTHPSLLPELLGRSTDMAVVAAEHGVELRPDTVYIIPPGTALGVREGRIELSPPTVERGVRLPVDHLFRSLSREYGPRAVGVVLSGAGSDGSAGLRDIKDAGGLVIAQDPESCGQQGMPSSAIETGLVDLVLQLEDMPAALARFASLPQEARLPTKPEDVPELAQATSRLSDQDLDRLAALLAAQLDFDLRVYKPGTIERRVLRRMLLSGFEDFSRYLEYLRQEAPEQQILVRDLLISVTDFFRDPDTFRALRESVINPLVADADEGSTLRLWVPGCATGEEAYSIAMEILDAIDAQGKSLGLQIFATDVDGAALAVARAGLYPPSVVEHVSARRLETYFTALDPRGYQVRPSLRDVVSFAVHDLTKDPPFSRMNLVSCRNVLIYLTSDAQRHVLRALHFALNPEGYLFLSTSESIGAQRDLFETVSKPAHIYKKIGASRPISVQRSRTRMQPLRETNTLLARGPSDLRPSAPRPAEGDVFRQAVLEAWVPPSIVVDDAGDVIFMHGELGPYLRFPQGDHPRLELSSVLRSELATRTRGALYKCRRSKEPVVALSTREAGSGSRVRISAKPAPQLGSDAVIVSFEEVQESPAETSARPESPAQEAVIEQLEKELQATREDLRSTVEELETSNEELRLSNEQSVSMNEELQSANEELEATTEELRSLNEELTTVNSQLREKVEQVEQAHNDLDNFFSSTKVATLFLDERLCIKRYTPAAADLLGLGQGDLGRHVGNVAHELLQNGLAQEARAVLEHLSTRSRQLQTHDQRWIARDALPYRTPSRRIEGVVVTFLDITELKRATQRLALREHQQAVIARIGMHALDTGDLQGFMDQVVRDVQETLETDFCRILELQPDRNVFVLRAGVGWREGAVGSARVSAGADTQSGYTLRSAVPVIVDDLANEKRFSGSSLVREHGVVSGMSCVIRDGDHDYGVIGAHTTQRRTFTEHDASFLEAVASVIGSAVGRYQARMRLAVELSVAQVLSESTELDEAMPRVLEALFADLHSCVGEVWWLDERTRMLSCHLRRAEPTSDERRVHEALAKSTFEPGEGMVGRVLAAGKTIWCTDLGDPALFARGEGARALRLVSGFGIPIRAGRRVIGVLTVFSRGRLFADDIFLASLDAIGRAIGDFVTRSELEQRAYNLAAITESSHDAIFSYDDEGRVTEWLRGAEQLFGFSAEEMVGRSVDVIVPLDRREELRTVNEQIEQGRAPEAFETVRRRKDGKLIEVSVRKSPLRDRHGRVVGVSSIDRDVTRLKETERQLLAASRQKDEFLAMLGHELRNPLAAILSASELLKASCGGDPRLERTQAVLERQSGHMAKLLDGLLDVSRIISGKIALEPETIDLSALSREVASDVTERISARQLDLRIDLPSQPIWVKADRVRMVQILDNLLSNAVKYTSDGGSITLALGRDDGRAILRVRDTGSGIDSDLLPHIFDVFRQSKQTLARAQGGLGLGLALVKSLVELQDGSIQAHSEGTNRGSEFVVRLPIASEPVPGEGLRGRDQRLSHHILVIEDNEDAAEMLRHVLELSGHRVDVATSGRQGIDMAKRGRPDVVLCDIGLPDISGFVVAEELRTDASLAGVRLVALSGYGRPEDKARGAQAGFQAHITKPVDTKALERILQGG